MKKLVIWLVLMLVIPSFAWAAGTCTATKVRDSRTGLQEVTWEWTSDASGDVSGTDGKISVTGTIATICFIPDATDTPTDAYDVTIVRSTDPTAFDILYGGGANRSDTATTAANCFTPVDTTNSKLVTVYNADLYPVVDNAGATTKGKIIMTLF